jgi:LysR family cyn operon transcriptional activator
MELRHLRYFAALAEQLNFTRAAKLVHVTQSTLSHQIKQLETEVGHPLFDRIGKRIVITDAGEQFLTRVTRALREIDEGLRDARGSAHQLSGHLSIGVTHTFNLNLIPGCIASFLSEHPAVRITVRELAADAVEAGVLAKDFDLGIAYRPHNPRRISFEPLYNDELALAVSPQHPFAQRKRVRMVELHRQQLALPTKDTTTRQLLDEWFRSVGAEPVVVVETNPIASLLAVVRGLNIAGIVSRQTVRDIPDLRVVPLENPTPMRTPGILWNRSVQPAVLAKSFAVIVRRSVPRPELPLVKA